MEDLNTFQGSPDMLDPLYENQKEGVAKMRASLLSCSSNPRTAKQAIQNITVLRVYHQIARIIKYTELMDKLEDKLYEALENTIEKSNTNSPSTWMMLLDAQERLQKSMIESHKLLQPYMDLKEYSVMELTSDVSDDVSNPTLVIDSASRERIRNSAQAVLSELNIRGDSNSDI